MDFSPRRGPRNGAHREWRMPVRAKWYKLYENDEDFQLWFDNNARGSPTTAIEMARVLYRFLGIMELTLGELTNQILKDQDRFEKKLMAFVGEQEKEGYAPGSIENYLKSVRSWANWHGINFVRRIKISNRNYTPSIENEKIPTIQEVHDIRSSASIRGRICVGAVAYAGLRPEVLGHQHINDGLKLGDLPELDIDKLDFRKTPALIEVRSELSKASNKYRTFFPSETCRDIIAYLQRREKGGEELDELSPLVIVSSSQRNKGWRALRGIEGGHITTALISRDIRNAMRPTYNYRPYVLRSYFSTRLLMAVSDGVMDNNYRVYWMGHKGEMAARYSSNKASLPDDLIENMRAAYIRARRYLLGDSLSEESMRKKHLFDTAKMLGFENEQLAKLQELLARSKNVDEAVEEFHKLRTEVSRERSSEYHLSRLEEKHNNIGYDVVQGEDTLVRMLKQGWELEKELNGNKFLLKKNH